MAASAQQLPDDAVQHRVLEVPVSAPLPGEDRLQVSAEVVWSAAAAPRSQALFCLPGGGMNRHYFDLDVPGDDSFSFAAAMARRGFIVILLDSLGIGDSSRPADGHALTVEVLAAVHAQVCAALMQQLRAGTLDPALAARPQLASIGVGHSMGAMLAVAQQAAHPQHVALAVLGFCTAGLPQLLSPQARELLADPPALRARLGELARKMFPAPYPEMSRGTGNSGSIYGGRGADPRALQAIRAVTAPLLPVPAFQSLLPGNVAAEAAAIKVPVFLGIGEHDMVGDPQRVPGDFPSSAEVVLELLPGAGHSHFLFPARTVLYDALAGWADALPGGPSEIDTCGEQR